VQSVLRCDLSEEMKILVEQYDPEMKATLKALIAFVELTAQSLRLEVPSELGALLNEH